MQQEQLSPLPPRPAEEIFAQIIANLVMTAMGRNPHLVPRILLTMDIRLLIARRINHYASRFAAIAARWRAGTLLRAPRDPDGAGEPRPRARSLVPRGPAWVCRYLSYQAAGYGHHLRELIGGNPEIQELLAAAPQLMPGDNYDELCATTRMSGRRGGGGRAKPDQSRLFD
jgi:hypothetical protein